MNMVFIDIRMSGLEQSQPVGIAYRLCNWRHRHSSSRNYWAKQNQNGYTPAAARMLSVSCRWRPQTGFVSCFLPLLGTVLSHWPTERGATSWGVSFVYQSRNITATAHCDNGIGLSQCWCVVITVSNHRYTIILLPGSRTICCAFCSGRPSEITSSMYWRFCQSLEQLEWLSPVSSTVWIPRF